MLFLPLNFRFLVVPYHTSNQSTKMLKIAKIHKGKGEGESVELEAFNLRLKLGEVRDGVKLMGGMSVERK
jgi:hypothetical protein